MKTIVLWDSSQIVVSDQQAEQVKQAIDGGADHFEIGDTWVRCSAVASIKPGGIPSKTLTENRLPDRVPLSSLSKEELTRRRAKIDQMRRDFFAKREARRQT